MDPRDFGRVKELFARAASLEGSALGAFLDTLDSENPEIRREVQRLLDQETSDAPLTGIRREVARAVDGAGAPAPSRATGTGDVIVHYELVRHLGAGGMGEVFLADDLALGRKAAIKLLRSGLDERYRKRLLREAWANAKLQHPAIATFYESGETDDGLAYLAIEYVPGKTLRERLKRGPLPPDDALAVASALLEGLIHAHEAGILHRDIKPENVMLTGERSVKLLDFGLARQLIEPPIEADDDSPTEAATASALTALTAHGAIAGTIGYMSPEQLRGETVDARTDVFAIGAVIYEMLTGQPAFPGIGMRERMAAVLSRDPDPVAGPGIPAEVDAILRRAMARKAEDRYPSAVELLRDVRRVSEGELLGVLPDTIAVLDLENVSGNADDDWIGTGIAESLAADLRKVAGLTVMARERVTRAAAAGPSGEAPDPRRVGLALGCRWVLEGTVQRMGPAVRITTSLRDVATGDVVASEKVDGKADDLFALQDRLSDAVASSLHVHAGTHDSAPDLDAFEEYSRGRKEWQTFVKGAMDRGRERMERALEADPDFAPALTGLAGYHAMQFNARGDESALDRAMEYARRALEVNPDDAEAHNWVGYVRWRQGRTDQALPLLEKAESLAPDYFMPPYFIGAIHLDDGDGPEAAIAPLQRSVRLNPAFNFNLAALGSAHMNCGNAKEALWTLRETYAAEKRGVPTLHGGVWLAEALRLFGDLEEADTVIHEVVERIEASDHMLRDMSRATSLCELARIALAKGDKDAARAVATQVRMHAEGRSHMVASGFNMVSALAIAVAAGDTASYDEAVRLLDSREGFSFAWGGAVSESTSRLDLARAALALGRTDEARAHLEPIASRRYEARAMIEGMDAARDH